MQPNTLYFGDNLQVLREHFPDESVDLVYLDPPVMDRVRQEQLAPTPNMTPW